MFLEWGQGRIFSDFVEDVKISDTLLSMITVTTDFIHKIVLVIFVSAAILDYPQ